MTAEGMMSATMAQAVAMAEEYFATKRHLRPEGVWKVG